MNPNDQKQIQTSESQSPLTTTTPGTEQVPLIKKLLPRLIVTAILINIVPGIVGTLDKSYMAAAETFRYYANIVFVIVFVIIILRTLSEKN